MTCMFVCGRHTTLCSRVSPMHMYMRTQCSGVVDYRQHGYRVELELLVSAMSVKKLL